MFLSHESIATYNKKYYLAFILMNDYSFGFHMQGMKRNGLNNDLIGFVWSPRSKSR
jgi:hypothetical protein